MKKAKTTLEYIGNAGVIHLGEDSKEWCNAIQAYVNELLDKNVKKVAVDFSGVRYTNSRGFSTLIFAYHRLVTHEIDVTSCNLDDALKDSIVVRATGYIHLPGFKENSLERFKKENSLEKLTNENA